MTDVDSDESNAVDASPSFELIERATRIEHDAFQQSHTGVGYLDLVIKHLPAVESNQNSDTSLLEPPMASG